VKEIKEKSKSSPELTITDRSLENEYYRVKVADNGDILSIYDKKASKEILVKPARLEFSLSTQQSILHGTCTGKTGKIRRLITLIKTLQFRSWNKDQCG